MFGHAIPGTLPGLPSNLTNSLLALPNGTVVYGTCYGLGISRDRGASWSSWQGIGKEAYENYVRGLAADSSGGLWIATEHKGLVRLDLKTGAHASYTRPALPDNYVFAVAVTPDGTLFAGTYGGGLVRSPVVSAPPSAAAPAPSSALPAAAFNPQSSIRNPQSLLLPAPAAPPTLDDLNAMLAALSKVPFVDPAKQPAVVRLDDDWLTKGDCLGRHGRYWGCWCAICSPDNYIWGAGPEAVSYFARIGPKCDQYDALRRWVQWLYTKNPNSLEMPPVYFSSRVMRGYTKADFTRRQAEWDDHGEAYTMSKDGPGLYLTLKIPQGLYYLSFYAFNKDGHGGATRSRDFTLSVRHHEEGRGISDVSNFPKDPELARGRIHDFWGGVYKRFLVRGPVEITAEIARNHSFDTSLAGVFLDLVDEEPVPYFHDLDEWDGLEEQRDADREAMRTMSAADRAARFKPSSSEAEAAARLFDELEKARLSNAVWWATEGRRLYAPILRQTLAAQKAAPTGPEKLRLLARATTCYYQLAFYQKWEEGELALGKRPARKIEKALRWDGRTLSCQGKGYEMVTQYLRRGLAREIAGDSASKKEVRP